MVIRQRGLLRGFAAQPIWEEAVIWGCEVVSHTYAARQPLYIEWLALEARYASALKRDRLYRDRLVIGSSRTGN